MTLPVASVSPTNPRYVGEREKKKPKKKKRALPPLSTGKFSRGRYKATLENPARVTRRTITLVKASRSELRPPSRSQPLSLLRPHQRNLQKGNYFLQSRSGLKRERPFRDAPGITIETGFKPRERIAPIRITRRESFVTSGSPVCIRVVSRLQRAGRLKNKGTTTHPSKHLRQRAPDHRARGSVR